jgi:hypothetical protein
MKEREKTPCYDDCPIEHDCFGGYLVEEPLCGEEITRIKKSLASQYPDHNILFAPQNGAGLRFKAIESINSEVVYKLTKGEIILFKDK